MQFSMLNRSRNMRLLTKVRTRIMGNRRIPRVIRHPSSMGGKDFMFRGAPLPGMLTRLSHCCKMGLMTSQASGQLATGFSTRDLSRVVRVVRGMLGIRVGGRM